MKKILLDLDGTLVDTSEGIVKSVDYALEYKGIHEEDKSKLLRFIGPPLDLSFPTFYGTDKATTEELILKYRERYVPIGLYESSLYPGVEAFMKALDEAGYELSLATCKPEEMSCDLLKSLGVYDYLDYCVGASLGPERRTKDKVLIEAMSRMDAKPSECVLIGDTRFDVEGAKAVGMDCIGITYGFGERAELESAGALAVFDTLSEVLDYIKRME